MKSLNLLYIILFTLPVFGQSGSIKGKIHAQNLPLEYANIKLVDHVIGTVADINGQFSLSNIPIGTYSLTASFLGYQVETKKVSITSEAPNTIVNFDLSPLAIFTDHIVVTGTKTFKRQTSTPVIVNVLSEEALEGVQACNLSEGLRFQPGLRVETDCQTCNYTQLRMNGLAGGYSQILINGRPIFSPLTGLYGMEQIPANMIERIEVVRGGGSVLYGSGAIGGTVNVITKIPQKSSYNLGYTFQNINGETSDHIISGNTTMVNEVGNIGLSLFVNQRQREAYDHNGDVFSELPELKNNSFGANLFFQPSKNQKFEVNISSLNEYRYGGELTDKAPHLALQSEERTHNVLLGSLDYQLNLNDDNSSIIAYMAGQNTDREHYTGIFPDAPEGIATHLEDPPYGISQSTTFQGGVQLNHRLTHFLGGSNVITLGSEYLYDDIQDLIEAYNYEIDQTTKNLGVFLQSDWEISRSINFLAGLRADQHNLVDQLVFSPRLALLYKLQDKNATQLRLSYGQGFRAPQAFDADLHIAFAGGGISRVNLDPNLREERSQSFSGSINYDNINEHWVAGFTIEGFNTQLDHAFFLDPIGEDALGERFVKRNGDGATVRGGTVELRANYDQKAQIEAGFTIQSSLFDKPVNNIDGLASKRAFLRTPNEYGYATLSLFPLKKWTSTINLVYTGSMEIAHFAGAPEQEADEYKTTRPFTELSIRTAYTFALPNMNTGLEVFGGIKNITNAYQNDFDSGKNRDSNYVYGPSLPRTIFLGIRIKNI